MTRNPDDDDGDDGDDGDVFLFVFFFSFFVRAMPISTCFIILRNRTSRYLDVPWSYFLFLK